MFLEQNNQLCLVLKAPCALFMKACGNRWMWFAVKCVLSPPKKVQLPITILPPSDRNWCQIKSYSGQSTLTNQVRIISSCLMLFLTFAAAAHSTEQCVQLHPWPKLMNSTCCSYSGAIHQLEWELRRMCGFFLSVTKIAVGLILYFLEMWNICNGRTVLRKRSILKVCLNYTSIFFPCALHSFINQMWWSCCTGLFLF